MVLYQGTDHELDITRGQMQAITKSLQVDDGNDDWEDQADGQLDV
jgi:hypothetical protein